MSELEKKFYVSLSGSVSDLSENNLIDTTVTPSNLGKEVLLSNDGNFCFIASNKSIYNNATNSNGDVFVYEYNSSNRTWSLDTSFYTLAYTDLSNHEFGGGAYPANFGDSLCCSADNTLLFVGVPGYRTTNISHGAVCVFEKSNNTWSLKQTITNRDSNGDLILAHQFFGSSVACSNDGSMLFIGTNASTYSASYVCKYDLTVNTYVKDASFSIKPTLSYNSANSNFGNHLACDASGNYLVVGSDYFAKEINSSVYYTGSVHIYENQSGSWSLLKECFSDISNNRPYSGAVIANGASIGKDVTISKDASKIVISTMLNGVASGSKYGVLYHFEYNSVSQTYDYTSRVISDVYNSLSKPFGEKIQLSGSGNYLIASVLSVDVNVYYYDAETTNSVYWKQNQSSAATQDIVTDISNNSSEYSFTSVIDEFGNAVSISNDGEFIVVGAQNYRYNDPSTTSSTITGQAMILRSKMFQTISSFSDNTYGYGVEVALGATTNSSSSPSYVDPNNTANTGNTVYYFKSGTSYGTIILRGIGVNPLKVTFSEDNDYLETSKTINITGRKANQQISYTAAIDLQGYIGVGQTSGLTYLVENTDTGSTSNLQASMNISGNYVQFDPIQSEFEGISVGISTVTISQSGDTYHNAASSVILTYDVQNIWSTAYPAGYNPGYTPLETGLEFSGQNSETLVQSEPILTNISNLVDIGLGRKDVDSTSSIFSIPITDRGRLNDLRRTNFKRGDGTFNMEIKHFENETVDYLSVTLKDTSVINSFTSMLSEKKDLLNSIENPTDIFQIEKYNTDDSINYTKMTDDYVTVRIYHPHDTLVVYHIDSSENVLEVNSTNFANSSVVRETYDSNYWYVKMPFSSGIGGTSSSGSSASGFICFPSNMYVSTDQGEVQISKINSKYHTIRNKKIKGVTSIMNQEKRLVEIKQNAFGKNVPNRDLLVSVYHRIYIGEHSIEAGQFVSVLPDKVQLVRHVGLLYNVLMEDHTYMYVNNCKVETLNPTHKIAVAHEKVLWNEQYSDAFKTEFLLSFNNTLKKINYTNNSISK